MRLILVWLAAACFAAEPAAPDAPGALAKLKEGNAHYAVSRLQHPHQSRGRRRELAAAQHPFAIVLSCADSRVPPEVVFDQGLGDLFVVRVAGNIVDDAVLGSLEYAAEHLHVRLLVVLGHTQCGAVSAAVGKDPAHGHIGALVEAIRPAADRARKRPGDLAANTVVENVRRSAQMLRASQPILAHLVEEGKLSVVGAVYHLDSGKIDWEP